MNKTDQYQEIRDAVRALCAQFPDEYHSKVDELRTYPDEFVTALTKAGWIVELHRKVSHYLQPILSHQFLNNLA